MQWEDKECHTLMRLLQKLFEKNPAQPEVPSNKYKSVGVTANQSLMREIVRLFSKDLLSQRNKSVPCFAGKINRGPGWLTGFHVIV